MSITSTTTTTTRQVPSNNENVDLSSSAANTSNLSQPTPLTFNNLVMNNSMYNSSSVSSSDSIDTDSSVSTIKLSSPSPKPVTHSFPNYYQPLTKQQIAAMKASASLNSQSSVSTQERNQPPSLVRKKSGELVKSSLKLPGLLQKSLSTSHLGNRSKSVRFASRLTNIKMFDGMDSPSTVSTSDNTPIHSPQSNDFLDDDDEYDFLHNHTHSHRRKDYFHWNWNGDFENGDLTSDTSSEDEDEAWAATVTSSRRTSAVHTKHREYRVTSHNIPMGQPQSKNVYLKSINLLKDDNGYLFGLINVRNMAFEKDLMIKLTLNNWETNINLGGSVVSYNRPLPNNFDQFKFRISMSDLLKGKPDSLEIQLCIKYTVNHNEVYWDNNNNNNYKIKIKAISGIKSYTYKKEEDEFPQFNELITKLIKFQASGNAGVSSATTATVNNGAKKSINSRYNLDDEHEVSAKPRSISVAPPKLTRPPLLKHSFSSSDINTTTPHRYSQSYKAKHQMQSNSAANSTPLVQQRADFNSLSYTDLINNYCFSNGADAKKVGSQVMPEVPISCSPSPASTFHSFSDSIHI
ncbi:regulatory subunit for phosphoprotein phosphatase type 1 [Scheffersomyces xylosifermentans]|uniref:regulatory subunit for phosphoprotein phosphatase type 1 n=1 Tax=Scheffersomyces xylosifermentans TaxID=1304137 RepID=UPI00315DEF32